MSIGNFFLKQLLKSKLKNIPQSEQDRIFEVLEKNPDLFRKIAEEAEAKMKKGQDQQQAIMETVELYRKDLQDVMGR